MHLIFVYGTLKRGAGNHHHLAGQTFVGQAQTVPGFSLYDLGSYPGMVAQAGDCDGVRGEVWSVDSDCLHRLDELEGVHEGLYHRQSVALQPPFADRSVEAYLYGRAVSDRAAVGSVWGD